MRTTTPDPTNTARNIMGRAPHATRRSFMRSLIAAGVAPTVVPSRVLGAEAPSNKISLGVIGVGEQGTQDMTNFLGLEKEVRVTAICDVNQRNIDRARERIKGVYGNADVNVYEDFRELNADKSIDAVLIALPVHWHGIPATDAVLNGKHLFLEKPMALSFEEASRVRAAVRKKGVVFQLGTQQRSDLKFRWACELARNGRLGQLKEIQVGTAYGLQSEVFKTGPAPDWLDWDRWVGPAPETGFAPQMIKRHFHENMTAFSLGMISCWGIHHMDIARWGQGEGEAGLIEVTGKGTFPKSGDCDAILNWDVRFEYEDQAPIRFTDGRTQPHGVRFVGSDQSVFVKRGNLNPTDQELLKDPANKYGTMPVKLPVSTHHAGNFIGAIRNGTRPICDIETAMRSDTLCQIALIAVKLGRKLLWNPKAERFVNDDEANRLLQPRTFRGDWKLPTV